MVTNKLNIVSQSAEFRHAPHVRTTYKYFSLINRPYDMPQLRECIITRRMDSKSYTICTYRSCERELLLEIQSEILYIVALQIDDT